MSQHNRNQSQTGGLIEIFSDENQGSENGETRGNRKRKANVKVLGDISNIPSEELPAKIAKIETVNLIEMLTPSVPAVEYLTSIDEFASTITTMPTLPLSMQNEINFDELNEKVVMDIMDYLPTSSLLVLSETSTRFNNILKQNPNRLPLPLKLNFDTNDFPTFERRYRSVKIENLETPTDDEREAKVMNILEKLGGDFRNVTFVNCALSQQFMARILGCMGNITSLTMQKSQVKMSMSFVTPILPALKKISISSCGFDEMSLILKRVTTVEQFAFLIPKKCPHENSDDDSDDDSDDVDESDEDNFDLLDHVPLKSYTNAKNFLKQQPRLQSLDINNGKFFDESFDNCPFQLKKTVLFISNATSDQLHHMHSFLLSQNHLEVCVFNILGDRDASDKLNESFGHIMSMKTMKDLKVVFYESCTMNEYFRDFNRVNPSVEKLFLGLRSFDRNYRRFIETTCRNFPNVKELCLKLDNKWLSDATPRAFEPLSELKHLEDLTFDNFRSSALTSICVPTLKTLSCVFMIGSNLEDWHQFFQKNKSVENVHVQIVDLLGFPLVSIPTLIDQASSLLPNIRDLVICSIHNKFIDASEIDRIAQSMAKVESLSYIKLCRYEFYKFNNSNDKSEVYLQVDKGNRELHSSFSTMYVL